MSATLSTASTLRQLERCFAAPGLAHLQSLEHWQHQPAVAAHDLWQPAQLEQIVDSYRRSYGPADRRALLSHWSKSYLEALLPSALAACLLLDRQLPLAFEGLGLQLDEEGSVSRILLPCGTTALSADTDPYVRYKALLEHNLTPFVEALARHARLSARALWGNVASYLAWALRLLVEHCGLPPLHLHQALQLFAATPFPDGRPNPIQRAYEFPHQAEDLPWRRSCCLRYCLPDLPHCGDCPLLRQGQNTTREKVH